MKGLIKFLFLFGILPVFLFTGCKDDDPALQESEFETLSKYIAQNDLDLPDLLNGWVLPGSGLNVNTTDYSIPDYYVIDLRSAADFNAGHIKDAHNTTLANVLVEAENAAGKPILAVCYTGQTAARAVGALRLMGFEAVSLKWGMSAWHPDHSGKWQSNATDIAHANWVRTGEPPALGTFNDPVFATNKVTGKEILQARVQYALNKSGWGVNKNDVLANPSNYFIINKWPLDSWNTYGHINGAYRIDEDLVLEKLNHVNPAMTNVVYCYTGQTSAITTMWMDVLGFDSKSILFGVNGINHSELKVGTVGGGAKKSWKGSGSGSELNFGYYDSTGNFFSPAN
jgi:rhodanese-related sulfurtransferase